MNKLERKGKLDMDDIQKIKDILNNNANPLNTKELVKLILIDPIPFIAARTTFSVKYRNIRKDCKENIGYFVGKIDSVVGTVITFSTSSRHIDLDDFLILDLGLVVP